MKRAVTSIEDLAQLLPATDLGDELRRRLMEVSTPDPDRRWAGSASMVTVDKRVVDTAALEGVLQDVEEAARASITERIDRYREVFQAYLLGDDVSVALRLLQLGEESQGRGLPRDARLFYEAALRLALPLVDKGPQILALRRLARLERDLGRLRSAHELYARSGDLARDSGDLPGEVVATIGQATVLMYQGRWSDAEARLRRALGQIEQSAPDELVLERGHVANNLGMVLTRQARYPEAEEWLDRAMAVWTRVDSPSDVGVCYHNLGALRLNQGRREEAREILQGALALRIPAALAALITTDLAQACVEDGLVSRGEEWGRIAEEYALRSRSPYYLGHMYRGLGVIARSRGAEGVTFFEKALEIARETDLPLLEGETLVDYAPLRADMGQTEEALDYLERARAIFTSLGASGELHRLAEVARAITPPAAPVGSPDAADPVLS